jgi:hypothetical protein
LDAAVTCRAAFEKEADQFLDAFGLFVAAAADAALLGFVAQDQPPAWQHFFVGSRHPATFLKNPTSS